MLSSNRLDLVHSSLQSSWSLFFFLQSAQDLFILCSNQVGAYSFLHPISSGAVHYLLQLGQSILILSSNQVVAYSFLQLISLGVVHSLLQSEQSMHIVSTNQFRICSFSPPITSKPALSLSLSDKGPLLLLFSNKEKAMFFIPIT